MHAKSLLTSTMSSEQQQQGSRDKPRSQTSWNPSVTVADKDSNIKQRTQSHGVTINPKTPTSASTLSTNSRKGTMSPYRTSVFYDGSIFETANALNESDINTDDAEMNEEIQSFLAEYELKLAKWEAKGQWIEIRGTLSGKISWYNSKTYRVVFDSPPGVEILNVTSDRHNMINSDAQNEEKNT